MPRQDDLEYMLHEYFDSWKTENLESQCWRRTQAGRIPELDDVRGGDSFRTDLQNALGESDHHYNVQTQPNKAPRSSKSSKSQSIKLAAGRSHTLVLIHRDATPKADAVRDAFKSSCSQNKARLRSKEDLHTKVTIHADGGWNNEYTRISKQAADYVPSVEAVVRDPLKELSEAVQAAVDPDRWGEIFAWQSKVLSKQRDKTMTDRDWTDYETWLADIKKGRNSDS